MTPEAASARVSRLLTMVPWLVNRQGVDIEQAARDLGIGVEQLHDDLELLFMCGYGSLTDELIDVSTEGGRIFIANAETIARPLRLTRAEALTLVVGLRALAYAEGVTDFDVVERTLVKLEDAIGAAGPDAAGPLGVDAITIDAVKIDAVKIDARLSDDSAEETRALVTDALRRHRRLRLRYVVPARDEVTERDVDPMRVLNLDGRWYLEGWCHRAEDTRLFRLDRVEDAQILDADGTPPAHARQRDLRAGVFVPTADDEVVTLDLDPAWEWVAEYYPVESVQSNEPGADDYDDNTSGEGGETGDVSVAESIQGGGPIPQKRPVRITLRASDTSWVVRLALRAGGGVRVVSPAGLGEQVAAAAGEALAAYEHDVVDAPGNPAQPAAEHPTNDDRDEPAKP
ncbi:MAG: WYL domain-containing protein [Tetrasphaera sp.]